MADLKARIDELAELMDEFGLETSRLSGEGWSVEFSRVAPRRGGAANSMSEVEEDAIEDEAASPLPQSSSAANPGVPINSPMTGIYYTAPNPGAPDFVKVGESVVAGQVVGLIEAMKVFNEITATMSGTVTRIEAENGRLVQSGDPLLYIA